MPQDIRPPGYFPQGTFSGAIPSEASIARRQKLADIMRQQMTHGPVQSWTQGATRLMQALGGAVGDYRAGEMEQQRRSALADVLRGGATPEDLFATGDEQLMNIAKFKLQQQQQQTEADRQAEMLRLAQAQNTREENAATQKTQPQFRSPTPEEQKSYPGADYIDPIQGPHYPPPAARAPPPTPLERQTQIEQAKADADRAGRIEGAKAFLQKVGRVEAQIGTADEKGNFVSGNEDLFGPFQSNEYWRQGAAVLGTEAESQRTTLESDLSDLELDVARMKLKGTGPISNEERLIARRTLPQLSNQDAKTAWNTLQQRKAEALDLINGGAGPKIEVPITTPRGQPQQHPMQGAPPPQPNVRAGEVPLPRTMGVVDTGNGPAPLPQIMTPADYAALPSGQHFLDPEGNERVKP